MASAILQMNNQNALQKMMNLSVIWPENQVGPFPVLYLLHGLSDNHSAWMRLSHIEKYVRDLPLIVVMPDGGRGFYCDAKDASKSQYETYIARDVINFVDNAFNTVPDRRGRVVAGLSMGGYGAMKFALKYPTMFCAAVSHSGALGFGHNLRDDENLNLEFAQILGSKPRGGADDLYALAEKIDREQLPALRIDCGVDDFLIEDNRAFCKYLQEQKIAHEYQENPGAHTWEYWDLHIQDSLQFFIQHLNLKNAS